MQPHCRHMFLSYENTLALIFAARQKKPYHLESTQGTLFDLFLKHKSCPHWSILRCVPAPPPVEFTRPLSQRDDAGATEVGAVAAPLLQKFHCGVAIVPQDPVAGPQGLDRVRGGLRDRRGVPSVDLRRLVCPVPRRTQNHVHVGVGAVRVLRARDGSQRPRRHVGGGRRGALPPPSPCGR